MCGTNTDCGCDAATQAHQARHQPNPQDMVITAALVAAADQELADGHTPTERFDCVLTVEGVRTTDHRRIEAKSLSWRNLPWNVMAQFENNGHRGAHIVGNIEKITREPWDGVEGGFLIKGNGSFDLASEYGRRAATMVDNQTLRFGSIDLEALKSEFIILGEDGEPSDGSILDIIFGFGDEELDFYDNITVGRIMGWTMVPMPAFPQAVVVPEGASMDVPKPFKSKHHPAKPLLASAAVSVPDDIPSVWFDDPALDGPTAMTIEADGHIFGHIALWDTCHIGFPGKCITPPRSENAYAYFQTGKIATVDTDGQTVMQSIGHITYDTGHAESTSSWADAIAHYDNTGTAVADIAVGEDEYGIWFNGAMRSNLDSDAIRAVRAAPLSGDWRRAGGGLELVAALAVNVPGFPIVASAGMVGDEQVSLRAAAVPKPDPIKELAHRVGRIEQALEPLRPTITAALRSRVDLDQGRPAPTLADLQRRVNGTDDFATGSKSLPLADEGTKWDGPGAAKRMKSEDGGEKPGSKTKSGHAWHDGTATDKFGSYKLPFADMIDGKLQAVPKGVEAAGNAIQGGRGGVDIPEADLGAVKSTLKAYYTKMGKTPPWEDKK